MAKTGHWVRPIMGTVGLWNGAGVTEVGYSNESLLIVVGTLEDHAGNSLHCRLPTANSCARHCLTGKALADGKSHVPQNAPRTLLSLLSGQGDY